MPLCLPEGEAGRMDEKRGMFLLVGKGFLFPRRGFERSTTHTRAFQPPPSREEGKKREGERQSTGAFYSILLLWRYPTPLFIFPFPLFSLEHDVQIAKVQHKRSSGD